MKFGKRFDRAGAAIAAAFFAASLLLGLLVPVYTDEVAWRFQARAAFDGGVDRYLSDNCGANTIAATPAFILPLRYVSGFFNAVLDNPIYIRLAGVATALAWAAILWLLIGRIAHGEKQAARLRIIGLSLLGFGMLPLLLVWSRPEQALLMAVTISVLVASRRWHRPKRPSDDSLLMAALAAGAILFVSAIALGYHLKGVVYLPLFAACILLSSRGRSALMPRLAAVALLALLGWVAANYWVSRFQCPSDPVLAAKFAAENAAAALFDPAGGPLHARLGSLLGRDLSPFAYVEQSLPARRYMADWLPPAVIGAEVDWFWTMAVRFGWVLALGVAILCLAMALVRAVRVRRAEGRLVLALVLLGILFVWSFSQLNKNSYESALALPVAMLVLLLAMQAPRVATPLDGLLARLHLVLLPIAIASQAALFVFYAPALWQSVSRPGYIREQPFSLSPYRYSTIEPRIVAAGRACGIDPAVTPRALLIDDLTYFPYMQSWRPLHRLGTLSTWNGSIRDPMTYLRTKGSDGLVIGCHYLPVDMRRIAVQTDEFCCIRLAPAASGN